MLSTKLVHHIKSPVQSWFKVNLRKILLECLQLRHETELIAHCQHSGWAPIQRIQIKRILLGISIVSRKLVFSCFAHDSLLCEQNHVLEKMWFCSQSNGPSTSKVSYYRQLKNRKQKSIIYCLVSWIQCVHPTNGGNIL